MATTAPIERRARILHGDCLTVLADLDADSVDAVVTDPPYGLEFMGKEWDSFGRMKGYKSRSGNGHGNTGILPHYGRGGTSEDREQFKRKANREFAEWSERWARAVLRVLKPGGHLLAFGGTRTYHRLTCAIEDAGFEIRDCLMWLYGSGFPKSLDVSKAIDKAAGAERQIIGQKMRPDGKAMIDARPNGFSGSHAGWDRPWKADRAKVELQASITAPATDAAQQWQGWGTALKPAYEPIVLARKPLVGTVAQNVQTYGTGAINVDGCRIPADGHIEKTGERSPGISFDTRAIGRTSLGRWPANVLHDGSDEVVGLFPQTTSGTRKAGDYTIGGGRGVYGEYQSGEMPAIEGNTGSAARFFYTAKASRRERGEGNTHPTVKPLALMRYLCKLITPPDGLILDPFAGSGSTGVAAVREGFRFLGIEQDDASMKTADRRTIETEFLPLERFLLDEGDE